MEESNELNDILIKNGEGGKGGNMKNILLFSAITLLMVFVGILAFKMVAGDDEETQKYTNTLPPKTPTQEDSLFKDEVEPTDYQSRIQELKRKTQQEARVPRIEKEEESVLPPAPKEEPAEVVDPLPQKVVEQRPPVPTLPTPAAKPEPKAKASSGLFYIQVASLAKNSEPSKAFQSQLKSNNLNFVLKEKVVNGRSVNRVYVGPFDSRKEANAVLKRVKSRIEPGAFVVKD